MEDKNEHIRYYILFDNHTQGMMLHELLCDHDIPNRIAPAPRATDGKAACGMALLIHPDDIEAAIFDSIKLSKDSFEGKAKLLEMKGE